MEIVNDNHHTRTLTIREREDGDPAGEVLEETAVEFDERGRAEVDDELGERLVGEFGSVREAEGPDDVAATYEREQGPPGLETVDFASDRAREIAEDEGLGAGDFEGETPTGETGFTADDVRGVAG